MDLHDKEMTVSDALSTLQWQIEMGADEALGDLAIDRYAAFESQKAAKTAAAQQIVEKSKASKPAPKPTASSLAAPSPETMPLGTAEAIKAAEQAASQCTSLQELKAAIDAFEGASQLKQSATSTVFGDGNPNADIMVIGEYPAERDDDTSGIAFSGRVGQLLNRMFEAINLTRQDIHVSNLIYWRPPGGRSPSNNEFLVFKPFVEKHIDLVKPKLVICLGAKPAQILFNQAGSISRLRGNWFSADGAKANIDTNIQSIATYAPAFLLDNPAHKRLAWQDLLSIKEKLNG